MPDGVGVDDRPDRRDANGGSAEELVYESERTRVTRGSGVDGVAGVVYKTSLGSDAVQRVRHETAILERLTGLPGIPQLAGEATDPTTLWLVDTGGYSLAELIPSMCQRLSAALETALDLSMIVAGMHRRGVIHKDINPGNIVISDTGSAVLIDYDVATTFAEERPDFMHQSEIIGTLAYLAPEQSGRTGRPVDQRARYGGEEFILVLPGADLSVAHQIGQRANAAVAALNEQHTDSPIGFVTVSVGVAAIMPSSENTPADLIRMADTELYEAKRNGRNRVGA
jgi:serine/threonine protein kinase